MHGVHIPVYYPVNVSFFLIFAGLPTTQAKNINTKKCTRRRAEDQMIRCCFLLFQCFSWTGGQAEKQKKRQQAEEAINKRESK